MHSEGKLFFSVDAALLRELGERLVGQAHVALGELIKNAYDADATNCEIAFGKDEIVLSDDGHGMAKKDFESFWMRVGTTHKAQQAISPRFKRLLTGSKGVGRLAVQFLARKLKIQTQVPGSDTVLTVVVNWPEAIAAGELVEAEVNYSLDQPSKLTFANGASHGMRIVLSGLNHDWGAEELRAVAREVWELVPPFEEQSPTDPSAFKVSVSSEQGERLTGGFSKQLTAALEQWIAKISGEIVGGRNEAVERVTVSFNDGDSYSEVFPIEDCMLSRASWEIKVYNLRGRLANDVPVQEARDYLERYGGVHVYDGEFRLPYYGVGQDWLALEFDHSHRRVKSKLLPDSLHVQRALNDLPTQGRLFGTVRINTGLEQRNAAKVSGRPDDHLQIQVTRDRLVSNSAYDQLRDAVRRSIDYYATRSMLRRIQQTRELRPSEPPSERISRMSTVLETFEGAMAPEMYDALKAEIDEFVDAVSREQSYVESIQQLLGPLASAGMAAIALEHETNRELLILEDLANKLSQTKGKKVDPVQVAENLRAWIRRVRETREVFAPLLNEEDRSAGHKLLVGKVVERAVSSTRAFTEGAAISVSIPRDLRFPEGSIADWSSLIQNVLVNAVNAVGERSRDVQIAITAGTGPGTQRWMRISDNGKGIDLASADKLFDPFRRQSLAGNRLGLGGLGLGLTIVRMIAESRKCKVGFISPEPEFSTTFELRWS